MRSVGVSHRALLASYTLATLYGASWPCLATLAAGSSRSDSTDRQQCQPDNEGSWSIGVFRGPSPFGLEPPERWRPPANGTAAWPLANPVLTCAAVSAAPAAWLADPFLSAHDDSLYLFHEVKNAVTAQGDIGVAQSDDGGASWRHLGTVLDEPWHLSYPFVFKHENDVYLLPEGSRSGALRLYRAVRFPTAWVQHAVLVPRPLVDATLLHRNGTWWLFGSDHTRHGARKNGQLEVWFADSLLGPWQPHPRSPVMNGDRRAGARMAGRLVEHGGQLYRWGQDCGWTYGHRLVAWHIDTLTRTDFSQSRVPFALPGSPSRKGAADWAGVRSHHLDLLQLPSGDWLAVADGDRVPSGALTARLLRRCGILAAGVLANIALAATACRQPHLGRGQLGLPRAALHAPARVHARPLAAQGTFASACILAASSCLRACLACAAACAAVGRRSMHTWRGVRGAWRSGFWGGQPPGRRLSVILLAAAALVNLAVLAALAATYESLLLFADTPLSQAVPVGGQYSRYTLLLMSYPPRAWLARLAVRHYSRCASVAEVVVVWNQGPESQPISKRPGEGPGEEFDSAVPLRVRVEAANSLSNRFRPDVAIRTRAVLSMDDDLLIPCADIEAAFAAWRRAPHRIVGFFPRLADPAALTYTGEPAARRARALNLVLTGAAFLDHAAYFGAYWAPALAPARALVDEMTNGEDVLMNFVVANATAAAGGPAVAALRARARLDASKLSHVALSRDSEAHAAKRTRALRTFAQLFGDVPLREAPLEGW